MLAAAVRLAGRRAGEARGQGRDKVLVHTPRKPRDRGIPECAGFAGSLRLAGTARRRREGIMSPLL
jgi:hypothetical protein